jgi:hypothetical protein
MRRSVSHITSFLLIILSGILGSSCFSLKYDTKGGGQIPGKTFSVQFVENQARIVEPGLSQDVTNSLKDYLKNNTNLIMVNNTGDNDFEAVITGYEPSTPSTVVAGDEAAQNKFTITIKVKYTCNVNPELDFEASFSRYKLYNVSGSGFESVKTELTKEIMDELLDDIYKRAFVNW